MTSFDSRRIAYNRADAGVMRVQLIAASGQRAGRTVPVGKVTWQKVGRVTEPGRYMFTFGWVTVTAEDLAIWQQFPERLVRAGQDAERGYRGRISSRRLRSRRWSDDRSVRTARNERGFAANPPPANPPPTASHPRRAAPPGAPGWLRPPHPPATAGDHGRSTPLGLTASTAKPSRASPQRQRALPAQAFLIDHQRAAGRRRLPRRHQQRRALAIVAQGVRPQRQRDQTRRRPAAPRSRPGRMTRPRQARDRRPACRRRRPPATPSARKHPCDVLHPDQMQPPVLAADADGVAVGGDQDVRLRRRQRPDHRRAPARPRRSSAAACATARAG